MDNNLMIKILQEDRCTKNEAEKLLKNGTTILEDFKENFDFYMQEWKSGISDEDDYKKLVDDCRKMVETGEPIPDWGVVNFEGKTYYIMYAL